MKMRKTNPIYYLILGAVLLFSLSAHAQEWQELDTSKPFKLGYARIKFPDGKWLVNIEETDRTILDNGRQDVARTAREFILLDKKTGAHLASAYIKASNAGGNFYTVWQCDKHEEAYAFEEQVQEQSHHCAYATGVLNGESFYEKNGVFEFQKAYFFKNGITLHTVGHYLNIKSSNAHGTQLTMVFLFRAGFAPNLSEMPKKKVPIQVGNKIAAWTDNLFAQAKSSIYSIFGNLSIPAMEFNLSPSENSPKLALTNIRY